IEAMLHKYFPKTAVSQALAEDDAENVLFVTRKETAINYASSNTFGLGGHEDVLPFMSWVEKGGY
ncbi:beta-ketoacyl-[acyl-carrier-protein] synthase II, partial [Enterococcus faecalis]